jgi:predicted nicotinamide N-methyase
LPPHPFRPDRPALLHRIHARYETVTETLRFGSLDIAFTRVADPDRVLDQVAAEEDRLERISGHRASEDQLHLPYWAELWDSAVAMGRFVEKSVTLRGLRVLDLGCGMGLAGTVAAALGARVLFADLEAPALLFARLNSLPYVSRVRTRRLNWQTDHLAERFDLILGADILYERKQWKHLEPFWHGHLAPGGSVLLGEPGRQTGDLFVDWITTRGWAMEQREQQVETRLRPVRLFRLTPRHV